MASRKLVRDLFLSKQFLHRHLLTSRQLSNSTTRLRLLSASGHQGNRQFSIFNEFSKQVKEATRNQEFQQSVKELKEKTEELKGVKEDLKVRTKQTTEQLYKHVDGVWTEAEATAKKVSANVKEKISAATDEVKETFRIGKQESSNSTGSSAKFGADVKDESKASTGEDKQQQSEPSDTAETLFGKFKSGMSHASPKVSFAFQKLKEAKPIDLVKKGYDIVKDELSGKSSRRKHIDYAASPSTTSSKGERSTRTEVVFVPTKQSKWSKKWEALREKMQGHPMFKRIGVISKPVVEKSQELAEDMRERWETSDHPVVHKIQDINESVFGETSAALSFKEIRRRDPSFSLPEFIVEVQDVVRPVLNAYFKGDTEVLKKYCSKEMIERCKAEHGAYESQGIFFDNKILHISEAEVRETKMMGDTPIIIVVFQTQQVYCVRDRQGSVTDGSKDTIHTVYYAWAMQQISAEELGEGAVYPVWKLREMQQLGIQALI
ncbi:mitochondrial import inner membrane translocase subunit TIM44-2-like [Cornus florida]|uniref:mitochondrial import inner membrane translocase subunit TIM44-2-like n=1 Tax=Cornus florida TaxID=4283 RepID=UPI00289A7293|nr:mitochondrial import inner membrane translocase subunit TIM44-2-like [Cornus florida]